MWATGKSHQQLVRRINRGGGENSDGMVEETSFPYAPSHSSPIIIIIIAV